MCRRQSRVIWELPYIIPRYIVTDTLGLRVGLIVHSAGIQDRDGAPEVLEALRDRCPHLRHIFADAAYRGPKLKAALEDIGNGTLEIITRSDTAQGFKILPRRWVVERTFAWLNRCRRLAKDWEKTIASATAWILVANIRLLIRRLGAPRRRVSLVEEGPTQTVVGLIW